MEFVDGWSPIQEGTTWPEPFGSDLDARRGLAFELVDGIARLARVDWEARGLEGFGKPDGFHERQVDRWLHHLEAVQFRPLPGIDEAAAWLRTHRPRSYRPGIMHGDYQFANVMYRHGAPARLAAIVDWEMATVGDPLLDLGWVINGWPDDTSAGGQGTVSYVDFTGMPSRDELLDAYATASGRPVDEIDYYVILARFKLAIVLEAGYARVVAGRGRQPQDGQVRRRGPGHGGPGGGAGRHHHAAMTAEARTGPGDRFDLTGRVALVTGGSRGLGRAMALGFADAGADVVVASRKLDACRLGGRRGPGPGEGGPRRGRQRQPLGRARRTRGRGLRPVRAGRRAGQQRRDVPPLRRPRRRGRGHVGQGGRAQPEGAVPADRAGGAADGGGRRRVGHQRVEHRLDPAGALHAPLRRGQGRPQRPHRRLRPCLRALGAGQLHHGRAVLHRRVQGVGPRGLRRRGGASSRARAGRRAGRGGRCRPLLRLATRRATPPGPCSASTAGSPRPQARTGPTFGAPAPPTPPAIGSRPSDGRPSVSPLAGRAAAEGVVRERDGAVTELRLAAPWVPGHRSGLRTYRAGLSPS